MSFIDSHTRLHLNPMIIVEFEPLASAGPAQEHALLMRKIDLRLEYKFLIIQISRISGPVVNLCHLVNSLHTAQRKYLFTVTLVSKSILYTIHSCSILPINSKIKTLRYVSTIYVYSILSISL